MKELTYDKFTFTSWHFSVGIGVLITKGTRTFEATVSIGTVGVTVTFICIKKTFVNIRTSKTVTTISDITRTRERTLK